MIQSAASCAAFLSRQWGRISRPFVFIVRGAGVALLPGVLLNGPVAVQQNISCPAFAFAVRALMARTGQRSGHHAGSLCQMLKNHAVNAVMRGFAHAAPVRHFVKSQSDAHQEPPERSC